MSIRAVVIRSLVVFGLAGLAGIASSAAQQGRASPHERVAATIDGAAVSITYGRPYMRGRVVMGGLVPYNIVWCPGADEATQITTSKPLRVGNLSLKAGSYTLWMMPSDGEWTLIVSTAINVFHTAYSSRFDLGTTALQKKRVEPAVEQLTFALEKNPQGAGGVIAMTWENTTVSVPFSVVQ